MKIDNKLSFVAAVLAFVGTIVIVMDRFGPVHRAIDHFPKWRNIVTAVKDLDTFDTKLKGGQEVGMVKEDQPGFQEFIDIILANRPDLHNKTIVAVVKNQPIVVGGVPMKIIHISFKDDPQGYSLTTDYIFHEWIREYRDKYFLKIGLSIIATAFLLSVFAHIKWKPERGTQPTDSPDKK